MVSLQDKTKLECVGKLSSRLYRPFWLFCLIFHYGSCRRVDRAANLQQDGKSSFKNLSFRFCPRFLSVFCWREILHLHTQCISPLMSAQLKDSHMAPRLNSNSRSTPEEYDWISYSCMRGKAWLCLLLLYPSSIAGWTQHLWPLLHVQISRNLPIKSRWIVVGDGQLAHNSDNTI